MLYTPHQGDPSKDLKESNGKEPHRGEKGKDGGRGNNVQGCSSLRAEPEFNHETSQTARAGGDISQCLLTGFQNYSGQETAVCFPFFFFQM